MPLAFPNISKIAYEGKNSRNPLAFKHYNADEIVEGKTMRDHLRFAVVYWHTFRGMGSDPFGPGTAVRPWDDGSNSVANAQNRARVAFEFIEKLGAPFYCWHDRDVAPEGKNLRETNKNFDAVAKVLKAEQKRTGIKLLWGTANLFSNPRFMHGAGTSCNADAFAFAAAQIKKAIEVTHELGGAGYTFWGGREGYMTLLNTDMKRELAHLAKLLHMAVDYKTADWLQRPVLHRAQAERTDEASIRFRCRRVPELFARIRFAAALQTEHRDESRHAGRAHDAARTRSGRRGGGARFD